MLIDSHCHLLHCYHHIEEDLVKEIEKNFFCLVNILINEKEIKKVISQPIKSNVIKNAIGIYPEEARNFNREMKNNFKNYLAQMNACAIGECGIDFHWDYGDIKVQEKLFRFQIEISIEKNLPLLIHSREAFNDTFRILKEYKFQRPFILHCFGYEVKEAEKFLELNSAFSFAGNITYPKAESLRNVLKIIPITKILIETDAPYLSPHPLRGKKNTPFNIKYTYEFIASKLDIEVEELEKQIEENFKKLFNISYSPQSF